MAIIIFGFLDQILILEESNIIFFSQESCNLIDYQLLVFLTKISMI